MKRDSILHIIKRRSMEKLESRAAGADLEKLAELALSRVQPASFKEALRGGDRFPAVIAELKKASPSEGLIREDFDVSKLAKSLELGGAAALSVLTEENYFLGSLENISVARAATKIPLLRKDFIYCKYQICEAAIFGASAVLLIAKMLDRQNFCELFTFAKRLNLDVLAEAHDADEIKMLSDCGADIIGVNCRNLENFHTDFSLIERLLGNIPHGIVKVAESAMSDSESLGRARRAGADAALVGTALMRAQNPREKLERMLAI